MQILLDNNLITVCSLALRSFRNFFIFFFLNFSLTSPSSKLSRPSREIRPVKKRGEGVRFRLFIILIWVTLQLKPPNVPIGRVGPFIPPKILIPLRLLALATVLRWAHKLNFHSQAFVEKKISGNDLEEAEKSWTGNLIFFSILFWQDVWTYQAVGIPMFRIFTINHRGELRHELTNTFKSSWVFWLVKYFFSFWWYPIWFSYTMNFLFSYLSMSQIADQLFPVRSKQTVAEEFSEFNYWREPIFEIEDLPLTKWLTLPMWIYVFLLFVSSFFVSVNVF